MFGLIETVVGFLSLPKYLTPIQSEFPEVPPRVEVDWLSVSIAPENSPLLVPNKCVRLDR